MSILSAVDCGTLKKCEKTNLAGFISLTSTATEIDVSDDVPNGTKAVILQLHMNNSSGSFYGNVGPESDKSIVDDSFYDYGIGMWHSDHVFTRVNSDRKFYIWAANDNAFCYVRLVGYYR
jgi:hypothetical protein